MTDKVDELRAQLGNEIAIGAFKEGMVPFPLRETCFPCHEPAKAHDFVFAHYAPTP